MEVHPERSTGSVVNNLPSSNTSEVTTNVMVPDGATMVIGGLIENDDTAVQQGTLGLNRLPVVGPLFRSKTQQTTKRELIVMLTPRIWKPEGLIGVPLGTGANCPPGMIGLASPNPVKPAAATPAGAPSDPLDAGGDRRTRVTNALRPRRIRNNQTTARPAGPIPAVAPALLPAPAPATNNRPGPLPTTTFRDVRSMPNPRADVRARSSSRDDAIRLVFGRGRRRQALRTRPEGNDNGDDDPGYPRHVVRRGESFQSIAERCYGSPRYARALWAANRREYNDPERIAAGASPSPCRRGRTSTPGSFLPRPQCRPKAARACLRRGTVRPRNPSSA